MNADAARCIVLMGTRPQARKLCLSAGLRSAVLVDGEPVTVFANRRQAREAINRTQKRVKILGAKSLHVDWLKQRPDFASLFSQDPFTIVPVEFLTSTGGVADTFSATKFVAVDSGRDAQAVRAPGQVTPQPELFVSAPNGVGCGVGPGHRSDDYGPNAPFNSVDCRP